MAKFPVVLFDFDGTLVESGPGILQAMRYMLNEMGHPPMTEEELRSFIGPPLEESFRDMLGYHGEDLERSLAAFRKCLRENGIKVLRAYPGVPEMLKRLQAAGVKTGVATCKGDKTAHLHADVVGISQYLDDIVGVSDENGCSSKADVIRLLMEHLNASKEDVVIIGDRMYDCEGAKEVGIPCMGVLYGYGDKEELSAYDPIYLAETPEAIADFLLEEN